MMKYIFKTIFFFFSKR